MASKRGLGRGFDSLIPTEIIEEEFDITASDDKAVSELRQIKISKIVRDEAQPRKKFDEEALNSLADSIREYGVLQPIVVVAKGDKFQIVAGERRWRASKIAGIETIPALVRTLSGIKKLETAIIENVQREDLNAMEFATALAKMRDQFNLSISEISKKIGKSLTMVSNHLRLFSLPEYAKKAVADGKMSEAHARQILALEGDEEAQKTLFNGIIKSGWNVRQAEQFVIAYKKGGRKSTRSAAKVVKQENEFTKSMSSLIGLPVKQKIMGKGAGQIIISYKDEKEIDNIKKALGLI